MSRKLIFMFILASIVLVITGCACEPPGISSVPVNLYPQHRDWWCWAAATEMISDYYGHRVYQPDSANFVHGINFPNDQTDCWQGCDCWGWRWGATIQNIKDNWDHWNFTYTYEANHLSWDDLKDTLSSTQYCGKSPVFVVWWDATYPYTWGHVVVAYGYAEIQNVGNFVSYRDPAPPDYGPTANVTDECPYIGGGGDHVSTYQAFVNDGVHDWGDSFHHFRYVQP